LKLELKGNILHINSNCKDSKNLLNLLIAAHYIIPILLNIEFPDPPVVIYTRGRVGEATFDWTLMQKKLWLDVTSNEAQEKRVADALKRWIWISQISNRRLAAATYYFYVARRLSEAGHSAFEFMAEVVLNLSKTLDALFGGGGNCEKVRTELRKLGYCETDIEEKFIPLMILRNHFDVGHASLRLLKPKQLDALHSYLEFSEFNFRGLLKKVIEKVEKGEYVLHSPSDLSLKGDKLRKMRSLLATFKRAKNPLRQGN